MMKVLSAVGQLPWSMMGDISMKNVQFPLFKISEEKANYQDSTNGLEMT